MQYLVTTKAAFLPQQPIAMVDGTVPGWTKGYWDLHFDHHAPNGGKVQIDEMPPLDKFSLLEREANINMQDANAQYYGQDQEFCIVTTQVDADACVAAAWMQITDRVSPEAQRKLRAIALDCDYLCIPPGEEELADLADFAAKAVAALKESTKDLSKEMGLPQNKGEWSDEQRVRWASEVFRLGTEWLIAAANGDRPFPGEQGEADPYFENLEKDIQALKHLGAIRLINGCAFFDQRSIGRYVDPRALVAIARELGATKPLTLTARSKAVNLGSGENQILIPGTSYTIGSLPYHEAASVVDLTKVFPRLAEADKARRGWIGQPPGETTWGGRAAVGGSGWNDASLLQPEEVLAIASLELNL